MTDSDRVELQEAIHDLRQGRIKLSAVTLSGTSLRLRSQLVEMLVTIEKLVELLEGP